MNDVKPKYKRGDVVRVLNWLNVNRGAFEKGSSLRQVGDVFVIEEVVTHRLTPVQRITELNGKDGVGKEEYLHSYTAQGNLKEDIKVFYGEKSLELVWERPLEKVKKLKFGIFMYGQGVTERFTDAEVALTRCEELNAADKYRNRMVVADYVEEWE